MKVRRPLPAAPKARRASEVLCEERRDALAEAASYIGSSLHKDTQSFVGAPRPRSGAVSIEEAAENEIISPDCMLCPRRWARRRDDATALLRQAIRAGLFVSQDPAGEQLPDRVWAFDPDDPNLVYEARRLAFPSDGYYAYPLTPRQAKQCPLRLA